MSEFVPSVKIDPSQSAAYIRIREGQVGETRVISEDQLFDTLMDFSDNGELLGIELIFNRPFNKLPASE